MKNILFFLSILLLLAVNSAVGQQKIKPGEIKISLDKVKHLVYPSNVVLAEAGSDRLIEAKILPVAQNIVSLTALAENFSEATNLTVVCSSGNVYTYAIAYGLDTNEETVIYAAPDTIKPPVYSVVANSSNTTHLFFPEEIIYAKQGNEDAIKIDLKNNFITINNPHIEFKESNLFCMDSKMNLYDIIVKNDYTDSYVYNFNCGEDSIGNDINIAKISINENKLDAVLNKVLKRKREIFSVGQIKNKFELSMTNVIIENDLLFFVFEVKNKSDITYNIDFIKCFVIDKKIAKNAVLQEEVKEYDYHLNFNEKIDSRSKNRFVLAFNKFTIPDNKLFKVEINEKNGGRHASIEIENQIITGAKKL